MNQKKILYIIEFIILFIIIPLSFIGMPEVFGGTPAVILIWLTMIYISALILYQLLHDKTFDKKVLYQVKGFNKVAIGIFGRFFIFFILLTYAFTCYSDEAPFSHFISNLDKYIFVFILYPLLCVLPQRIIVSVWFSQYIKLKNNALFLFLGAFCFAFAHIFFLNIWVFLFTLIGGFMFLRTYQKTQSMLISTFEHALYGNVLLVIGWGSVFHN